MDKYEILLRDLEEILKTVGEVNRVSQGKVAALSEEDTFTTVYITPEVDNYALFKQGTGINAYDNTFFVRLTAHVDCKGDDLLWVNTRHSIINAILKDSEIWTNIVDRDIVSVAHDDYDNYPRKAMAFLFEFRMREECVI